MVDCEEEKSWDRVRSILKCSCQINMSKIPTSQLASTRSILADVAHRFDEVRIWISVLNVCEKSPTRVKSSRLLGTPRNVVVCAF